MKFLSEVNDSTIRKAIGQFQAHNNNAIKHLDHVCCCFSQFVDSTQLKYISNNNPVVIAAFDTDILYYHKLDFCGHHDGSFNFCYNY